MKVSRSRRKMLEKLMRKNPHSCSMCKRDFLNLDIVYTCLGYDAIGRLQVVGECCHSKLKRVIEIGLFGDVKDEDFQKELMKHPLYNSFNKEPGFEDNLSSIKSIETITL